MSNPKNDINFLRARLKKLESLLDKKETPTDTFADISGTLKKLKDTIDPLNLPDRINNYEIDFSDLKGFKTAIAEGTNIPSGLLSKFADKDIFDGVKDDFGKIKTGDLTVAAGLKGLFDDKVPNTNYVNLSASHVSLSGRHSDLKDSHDNLSGSHINLSGLHNNLSSSHNNLSGKHTDLKNSHENLSGSHIDLSGKHIILSGSHLDLSGKHSILSSSHISVSSSHIDLSGKHSALSSSHINISSSHADLSIRHVSLSSSHIDLSGKHSLLSSSHVNVSGGHAAVSSSHIYLSGRHDALSSSHISISSSHVDLSGRHSALSSSHVNISSSHIDLSGKHAALSSSHVNISSSHADLSIRHVSLSSSHILISGSHGALSSSHIDLSGKHTLLSSSHTNISSSHAAVSSSHTLVSSSHNAVSSSHNAISQSHASYTGSFNTLSASHALYTGSFTTLSTSHINRLGNLDNHTASAISRLTSLDSHTSSINNFSSSHGFKLSSIAFSPAEEGVFKYASLSLTLKNSYFAAASDPTTGYDKGKWYFTNTFPSGNADYKLSSYSYQGYDTQERYNKEDFITYRKRLYTVTNNAYSNIINQESELLLQAGKTTIRAGTPNSTTPALKIIGESAASNGVGDDQGQLLLQDEDNTSSGLMLGYKYVSSGNEYGRIQAKNSSGVATDLYINAAGGSVRINRLNSHAIDDSAIELNSYGSGDRNSYIDFHSYGNQDYDSRIIRWSGQAGIFELTNTYSRIRNSVSYIAGTIFDWVHAGTQKMYLDSNGYLTLAGGLSDERIKTDIATSSLGLDFINNLNPVQFKYIVADEIIDITKEKLENNKIVNDGSRKTGVRNHYGFIAQQVKTAVGEGDFAGVVYEPEKDLYKLNHQEFISPMVKAIQELSQKNDYLEKKLEEKDKQLQDILLRLSALEGK